MNSWKNYKWYGSLYNNNSVIKLMTIFVWMGQNSMPCLAPTTFNCQYWDITFLASLSSMSRLPSRVHRFPSFMSKLPSQLILFHVLSFFHVSSFFMSCPSCMNSSSSYFSLHVPIYSISSSPACSIFQHALTLFYILAFPQILFSFLVWPRFRFLASTGMSFCLRDPMTFSHTPFCLPLSLLTPIPLHLYLTFFIVKKSQRTAILSSIILRLAA